MGMTVAILAQRLLKTATNLKRCLDTVDAPICAAGTTVSWRVTTSMRVTLTSKRLLTLGLLYASHFTTWLATCASGRLLTVAWTTADARATMTKNAGPSSGTQMGIGVTSAWATATSFCLAKTTGEQPKAEFKCAAAGVCPKTTSSKDIGPRATKTTTTKTTMTRPCAETEADTYQHWLTGMQPL